MIGRAGAQVLQTAAPEDGDGSAVVGGGDAAAILIRCYEGSFLGRTGPERSGPLRRGKAGRGEARRGRRGEVRRGEARLLPKQFIGTGLKLYLPIFFVEGRPFPTNVNTASPIRHTSSVQL